MANQGLEKYFQDTDGILEMVPDFIPRDSFMPGRRLRLHPDDYAYYGTELGMIEERWFCATAPVEHGVKNAPADLGMQYIDFGGQRMTFKDAVSQLGSKLIGQKLWNEYGRWPMFSKFYDYATTSFFHVHPSDEAARCKAGAVMKPEAYYYPPQMNMSASNANVITYLGLDPSVTKEELRERLAGFTTGENKIVELARAYRLQLETGWYTPAGVLHGCGAWCTYEPQWMSESYAVLENYSDNHYPAFAKDEMNNLVPDGTKPEDEIDYVMSLIDWEINTDPMYRKKYFRKPIVEAETPEYVSKWITYGNPYFGAKELTLKAGQTALIKDQAAYGCILLTGHGTFGGLACEAPQVIRMGQMTKDEFFVSEARAQKGVLIHNAANEDMVMLKHFCNNCGMPPAPAV
ncbi:MAG: hypothetical protein VB099_07285 [Candidatus Limiplasma sp.]|nr:hypothetical protein [Candidatus Limiplasma sp.]